MEIAAAIQYGEPRNAWNVTVRPAVLIPSADADWGATGTAKADGVVAALALSNDQTRRFEVLQGQVHRSAGASGSARQVGLADLV